jgi:hypothetical protein
MFANTSGHALDARLDKLAAGKSEDDKATA